MRKNMQAMKPIAGIQVPNENICEMLTPIADNSSIPVSVKYTCMCRIQINRATVATTTAFVLLHKPSQGETARYVICITAPIESDLLAKLAKKLYQEAYMSVNLSALLRLKRCDCPRSRSTYSMPASSIEVTHTWVHVLKQTVTVFDGRVRMGRAEC